MSSPQAQELEVMPPPSQQYISKAEEESLKFLNPKLWAAMSKVAQTFIESGALPQTLNIPKCVMVLQAGYEMGLKPLEALNSFYFVNGKISLYGEAAIMQVRKAGHKIEWIDCNEKTATCKITRCDTGESLSSTFTMEMVKARGWDKNQAYRSAPENMLKFKAFHATAKFICPDALHGHHIKEEIEADPTIIVAEQPAGEDKGTPVPPPEPPKPKEAKKKAKTETVEAIIEAPKQPEAVQEAPVEAKVLAGKERYDDLIARELSGEALELEDIAFMRDFAGKQKAAS